MKYANEKRTDKLQIRIEPTLREIIDDLANEKGISVSEFIRILLIKEVDIYIRRNEKHWRIFYDD